METKIVKGKISKKNIVAVVALLVLISVFGLLFSIFILSGRPEISSMFLQENLDLGDRDSIGEEVQNTEYTEGSAIDEPLSCATGTIEYVKIGELSPIKKETTSYYLLTNMGEYPIHSFERSTFSSFFDVSLNSYQEDFYWNLANGQNYIFYIYSLYYVFLFLHYQKKFFLFFR